MGFTEKLTKARGWRKRNKTLWFRALENNGVMDLEDMDECEHKAAVKACSTHPNEHPHVFTTHHCDSPLCPVCTVRRWQRESVEIKKQLDGVSSRYFHVVFTIPPALYSLMYEKKNRARWRKLVRKTLNKVLGGSAGGAMSLHEYGDEEPGKFKPHIHVLLPAVVLSEGAPMEFKRIPHDVLKAEYKASLERVFKIKIPSPVVHIKWFEKEKLYHRSRYLVHVPFEISDMELFPAANTVRVRVKKKRRGVEIPMVRVLSVLGYGRRKGHRYQWFGYMAYNAREKWRPVLSIPKKEKKKKASCAVCGADMITTGYMTSDGHFEVNMWLAGDFLSVYHEKRVYEEFREKPPPELITA